MIKTVIRGQRYTEIQCFHPIYRNSPETVPETGGAPTAVAYAYVYSGISHRGKGGWWQDGTVYCCVLYSIIQLCILLYYVLYSIIYNTVFYLYCVLSDPAFRGRSLWADFGCRGAHLRVLDDCCHHLHHTQQPQQMDGISLSIG